MSLFEQMAQALGSALGGKQEGQPELVGGVLDMLGKEGGSGLAGLIEAFQSKGLGEIVSSWVSTGENLPVSPEQIRQVLGSQKVQELAAQAGIKPDSVLAQLANLLPVAVDKLTPGGVVPETGALQQALGLLRRKLQ